MKTYSRSDWNAAQEAWRDFSDEWRDFRHQAAMRGILFPPSGTKYDSWEDDSPSQRAILIRAIRETPRLLEVAIRQSHSWVEVLGHVFAGRDERRAELARADVRALTDFAPLDEAIEVLRYITERTLPPRPPEPSVVKADDGKLSPDQEAVMETLRSLEAVQVPVDPGEVVLPRVEVAVWRPRDFAAIAEILR